jgi:Protein of unknown function (DUF4232)
MRPARIITAVVFAAAIAITGCSVHSTPTNPSPAPQPPGTAPSLDPAPTTKPPPGAGPDIPPSTPSPSGGQPAPTHCAASALRGSVQGSDGAAGHIWYTIQLRNASARTCTLRGIPQVRLLGAQGQPVTAPSQPGGPGGSLVVLRPGAAARFSFSEPNACDSFVAGSRLRVTLPASQGSLIVPLGAATRFGTCASVGVQALEASTAPTTPTTPRFDRISDPQVAADRLVAAWVGGDRAAAGKLTTSRAVTDRLFSESPPAERPAVLPCRLVADLAVFVCSYPVAKRAELSLFVEGGASAGYSVSGVEFGD